MKSFTDLEVWKKSRMLRNNVSVLTKSFPSEEKYRLTDQIVRSSRSIGNNIAEGHGRYHFADSSKFLLNARGSAIETIDHLVIALDENYIKEETFNKYKEDCEECIKMINGYIKYLRNQSLLSKAN
ncbi:four helix bundle protein [Mucilaginibacter achroorhodeus]|uniref:Four helix bundle protein n=1 Tax=Mucilaginibacter achroorhodeus TaxID=2599294 RepID=A0A563U8S8_9SPHI|nr:MULTISPECIES: four helix bundle protein [Mucilaginibacter]QXV67284.1 four helix bundle protein [Mucilaginibacter sp. 21P]TWR27748.1 four helix bundle protein [Mucilaginibacter achroorhodeus]